MIVELVVLTVSTLVAGFMLAVYAGLRRTHWYDRPARTWRLK